MVGTAEGLVLHHGVRPQCSYHWSLLEDLSDILGDLQQGHLRGSHTLNAIKDEVLLVLSGNRLLRNAFPTESESLVSAINKLFDKLPPSPQNHFAELKKRKTECRRAAMAARRLHHRCSRRRATEEGMTWTGVGGLIAADLFQEVLAERPEYGRIDRLVHLFLLDSLYRGYNINYLTTLFDRYLSPQRDSPVQRDCRDGLLHAFRRIHTRQRHQYDVYFALNGTTELRASPASAIHQVTLDELDWPEIEAEFAMNLRSSWSDNRLFFATRVLKMLMPAQPQKVPRRLLRGSWICSTSMRQCKISNSRISPWSLGAIRTTDSTQGFTQIHRAKCRPGPITPPNLRKNGWSEEAYRRHFAGGQWPNMSVPPRSLSSRPGLPLSFWRRILGTLRSRESWSSFLRLWLLGI